MAGMIIDSLIVSLGLDAANFDKGQKDAVAGLKKIEDQANKSNASVETGSKGVGEAFDAITKKALGFIAIVAGGRSFEQLFVGAVQSSAAIGRLAGNINMATSALSGWQNAAKANGGTSEGISNALMGASQGVEAYKHGQLTEFVRGAIMLGVPLSDDPAQMMLGVSDKLSKMPKAEALYDASQMGIDQGTLNFLNQGPSAVAAQVQESSNTTDPEALAAQKLTTAFENVTTQVDGLAKALMVLSAPTLATDLQFFASELDIITGILSGKISIKQAEEDFKTGLKVLGVVAESELGGGSNAPSAGSPDDYSRGGNVARNNYRVSDEQWSAQTSQESGGKQFAADGSPLLGRQTKYGRAVGIAQILPDTAQQTAKDNGVAWDQDKFLHDPAYNSMLGRMYMNQMMVKYRGDYSKALAAYNWGPGNLDRDISQNGGNWLSFAPDETRNYVRGIAGARPLPSDTSNVVDNLRKQQVIDAGIGRHDEGGSPPTSSVSTPRPMPAPEPASMPTPAPSPLPAGVTSIIEGLRKQQVSSYTPPTLPPPSVRAQQGNQASNTTTVHIGTIQVHAPHSDAKKVVNEFGRTLKSTLITAAANTGLS